MFGAPEGITSALGRIYEIMKAKVYISGAITGCHMEDVEARFKKAKDMLERKGVEVISPLENGLPPEATWEQHMSRDLEMLAKCDIIYMLEGWDKSRGCQIEFRSAINMKMTIIFEQNENERLHKAAAGNKGGKLVS